MQYLIVGLGKTGQSIARYLSRRHHSFAVFDTRLAPTGIDAFRHEFPDTTIFLGELPTDYYRSLHAAITSPGVSLDHPVLQQLMKQNVPIYGDIECLAREMKAPVIAITGTNGKSTVTTLVGEMTKAAGIATAVAGNIGDPVLDVLDNGIHYDLWVLELSSFQLDLTLSLAPLAATILNVSADHLDRHHTFTAYVEAKQRVYRHAKTVVYNREDNNTLPTDTALSVESYGLDEPEPLQWGIRTNHNGPHLAYGEDCFLPVDAMRIKGKHNWANALAACALAHTAGVSLQVMAEVLQRFSGLSHRTEWLRKVDDVDWIDDSKGTNIGATISAIAGLGGSMVGQIVLIAGGQGKGADFRELRPSMRTYVRAVVLIGEDADKLKAALQDVVAISNATSLEEAVLKAKQLAKPGDIVLLSPACASLDMFRDYNHRGEVFAALVGAL